MVAVAATVVAWTLLFGSTLPAAVSGTDAGNALVRNPAVLGSRFGGTLLLLAAAVGFVRKARRLGDPVFDWLASGAVLMATARFHDFLFPSLHDDWVTTGDMLRVVAHWVVLAGLLYEVAELWRRRGADAARDERRRRRGRAPRRPRPGARLHQHAERPRASGGNNDEQLAKLHRPPTARWRDPPRRSRPTGTTGDRRLDRVIAELGRDVEQRYGCHVVLDLDDDISVDSRTAHELGRVAREALVNAARHAAPKQISARLAIEAKCVQLSVADDGDGIRAPDVERARGFGLTSMRERAERLGASYRIVSAPGRHHRAIEVPQR